MFRKYVFSLAVLFRWQLAYPGQPIPFIGRWFGELNAPSGLVMLASFLVRGGAANSGWTS